MTTKILTGTYSAGYTLSPAFAELIITPPAVVGGAGVRANALATIENEGSIVAGAGVAGGAGHYQGGAGSIGVQLVGGGRLVNFSTLSGGQGGAGGYDTVTAAGYNGGAGGIGALVLAASTVVDHATITGGAGGDGGYLHVGVAGNAGAGGDGGDGLVLKGGGSLAIGSGNLVAGGQGGDAGANNYDSAAGGGAGGIGVDLQGAETISNFGTILAGAGGGGGHGYGLGGGGGVGLLDVSAEAKLTNTGLVEGGQGGYGGGSGAAGGAGGAAVEWFGAGQIANAGAILGGAGGSGGPSNSNISFGGTGGAGGVGVFDQGQVTLTNGGVIAGGDGGAGGGGEFPGYEGLGGDGVYVLGGTIANLGTIESGGGYTFGPASGILMLTGGTVTNGSSHNQSASIIGQLGIAVRAGSANLTNYGTISASVGDAVSLSEGVAVNTGVILGGADGGAGVVLHQAGVVSNSSVIAAGQGADGEGAHYQQDGSAEFLFRARSGDVGGDGVALLTGGSIANQGGIAGGAGGSGGNAILRRPTPSGYPGYADGGGGGAGGTGVYLLGSSALTNSHAISGGAGGAGGTGWYGPMTSFTFTVGGAGGAGGNGGAGVVLTGAGTVSNSGTIAGADGAAGGAGGAGVRHVYQSGSGGNGGAGGAGGDSVDLLGGGVLDNSGVIEAGTGGLGGAGAAGYGGGASGTAGANGAAGDGVVLTAGGVVTNGSTMSGAALISGAIGVYAQAAGATVINFGTIVGSANAVKFGSAGDVLIAESGARFVGAIAGGGGVFELDGGSGTIAGLGGAGVVSGTDQASFSGFGAYVIGAGGQWTLAGFNAVARDQSLTVDGDLAVTGTLSLAATRGTLAVGAGGLVVFSGAGEALAGTITGAGSVAFTGGSVTFNGSTLSAAQMTISGASVTLGATITNSGTVSVATPSLLIGAGGATLAGGTWALTDSAANKVTGLAAGDTLNNVNATISGAGMLGAGQMVLINRSDGVIDGNGQNALIIDTGSNQIATSGLIEAAGAGGVTIQSAVLNGGRLEANGGTLTVNGAVTGAHGSGVIAAGALIFNSTFAETVQFSGTSGMLGLAKSQTYTGAVLGFSHTGGTSLDLGDIAFVNSTEATFSGTATSGVLAVTDGTHTAHITLLGDYYSSTFTASSDGHGGTIVVDTPKAAMAPAAHQFIAAMAGMGASSAGVSSPISHASREPPPMLTAPRTQMA